MYAYHHFISTNKTINPIYLIAVNKKEVLINYLSFKMPRCTIHIDSFVVVVKSMHGCY